MTTAANKGYFIFLIIFLGMMSAFGPFVTDMYLPTLPALADIFHTTTSQVQMGLTTSMLGLALGQIFFGPLSDKYGRKSILLASMLLFCVSTVAAIYSTSIEFLNGCRFLQGLGGSGGIVLSRSVATDNCSGRELARMLAIIGAVNGIAPVVAPVMGGAVSEAIGWQGIFWILFGIGVLILLMSVPFRESHPAGRRYRGSIASLMKNFPILLRQKYFVAYTLLYGFTCGVLFSYISSASFIIQSVYGYSEFSFAIFFAVNSTAIAIGSALSLKFRTHSGAILFGASGVLVVTLLQLLFRVVYPSFWPYEILTFVMLLFIGFIFPSVTTLAMNEGRAMTGTASAIFGASCFLFGGIVSPLVGIGNIMTATITLLILCALATLLLAVVTSRRRDLPL